jgi:PPOX class probable F420-dependent enzyme
VTLSPEERAVLTAARRGTLATIDPAGRPRLVPVCFVVADDIVWSPLDEKPKTVDDVRALARVRDIAARPAVALLIDHWSEDWAELAWIRLRGDAVLVEPADVPVAVIEVLRSKYRQYADHDLEHAPMLRISVERATSWFAADR